MDDIGNLTCDFGLYNKYSGRAIYIANFDPFKSWYFPKSHFSVLDHFQRMPTLMQTYEKKANFKDFYEVNGKSDEAQILHGEYFDH